MANKIAQRIELNKGVIFKEQIDEKMPEVFGDKVISSSRVFFTTEDVPVAPPENHLFHFVQIADAHTETSGRWQARLSNFDAPVLTDRSGIDCTRAQASPEDLEVVLSQIAANQGTKYLRYIKDLLMQSDTHPYFQHLTADSKSMLQTALEKAIAKAPIIRNSIAVRSRP